MKQDRGIDEIVDQFVQRRARIRRLKREELDDKELMTKMGLGTFFSKKYVIERQTIFELEIDVEKIIDHLGKDFLKPFLRRKKHVSFVVEKVKKREVTKVSKNREIHLAVYGPKR